MHRRRGNQRKLGAQGSVQDSVGTDLVNFNHKRTNPLRESGKSGERIKLNSNFSGAASSNFDKRKS